jgi:hypothetical protein
VFDIRRASGLPLFGRVDVQVDRDALLHRLETLDQQMAALTDERIAIIDELARLRDVLYPPIPWCHGRRPPDLDTAPLPAAPVGAEPLTGRPLRGACLEILRRHGPLPLRQLHGLLHRYGYVISSRRPVPALSDAMRHEVRAGRARRVRRGVYAIRPAKPDRTSRRAPDLPPWPDPGIEQAPTPLDPVLDEDPHTWSVASSRPSIPP